MHMCHCMHATENILKSEGNLLESVLSFHQEVPEMNSEHEAGV